MIGTIATLFRERDAAVAPARPIGHGCVNKARQNKSTQSIAQKKMRYNENVTKAMTLMTVRPYATAIVVT